MHWNNRYVSSARTLQMGHVHKTKYPQRMHEIMLSQDLCNKLSFEFSPSWNSGDFYAIEAPDDRLDKLLKFNSYDYFRYDFERILSECVHNLCLAPKTYIEFAVTYDEKHAVIGLSLIPFDAIKILKLKKSTLFFSKKRNGNFCFFKIPNNYHIEFSIREMDIKKTFFKSVVRKLKRVELNRSTELVLDSEMENKFDFSKWKTKADFLKLKYPYKIGWVCRDYDNPLLSESYFLYRSIRFKMLRKKFLEYLLQRINIGIGNLSEEIAAEGKIVISESIVDYEKEWHRFSGGEICTSELSDIVFKIC